MIGAAFPHEKQRVAVLERTMMLDQNIFVEAVASWLNDTWCND